MESHVLRSDLVAAGGKLTAIQSSNFVLTEAATKANTIKNIDPELGELLLKLKQLEEDTLGLYRIKEDTGLRAFFEYYANNPEISGHSITQSVLFAAIGQEFSEPIAYPETGSGARQAQQSEGSLAGQIFQNDAMPLGIKVYPNPASTYLSILIEEKTGSQLSFSIVDVAGKIVINGILKPGETKGNIDPLVNGIYFISVKDENTLLYKQKFAVDKN